MSNLIESIEILLNDVETFCTYTLQNENLSKSTSEARNVLIEKLITFRKTLPQYNNDNSLTSEPVSPPPYLDMKGTTYIFSDVSENSYEICDNQQKIDNEDQPLDSKSVTCATAMINAVMKGYLEKKSRGLFNQYHKRWCVINNGILYYFAHITDTRQIGSIQLYGYEVHSLSQAKDNKRDLGFELICPGKRTYQFLAANKQDMLKWITAIESEVAFNKNETCQNITEMPKFNQSETEHEIYELLEEERQNKNEINFQINQPLKFKPEEWYLGKWDCISNDQNELSFKAGQLIRIINKEYDNFSWWVGEISGKFGLIPKNYLMEAYEIIPKD